MSFSEVKSQILFSMAEKQNKLPSSRLILRTKGETWEQQLFQEHTQVCIYVRKLHFQQQKINLKEIVFSWVYLSYLNTLLLYIQGYNFLNRFNWKFWIIYQTTHERSKKYLYSIKFILIFSLFYLVKKIIIFFLSISMNYWPIEAYNFGMI